VKLGVFVLRPLCEGGRYDLIFDVEGSLLRVQCKWAARNASVIAIQCLSARRTRSGFSRRRYTRDEVDALAAFCADLDRCYLLPPAFWAGRSAVQLRVAPTLNNQRLRIHWTEEYEFEATLRKQLGAVAQLGERGAGSAEVTGSSPVGSICTPRPSGLFA
jgi:PD-(D/E)XK endonuclease